MDQRETAIFYRRILHPGVNLLNHANTLGVKLRSKTFVTDYPIRQGHLRKGSPRRSGPQHVEVYGRAGSAHRREQGHHPTPTYIHDVVVPLNSYTAASFSQERTSAETPRSLFSQNPSRSKSAGLGPVPFSRSRKGSAKLCTVKTTRSRPLSVHADSIYDSTSSLRAQEYGGSLNSSRQNANDSGQAIRFGSEMENRAQCQTRKRISEIRPHRVDRMYYMSGAPLHIQPKYHVEDEELTHLREISRSRKSSKHYGRGLSKYKYMGLATETHLSKMDDFTHKEHYIVQKRILEDQMRQMRKSLKSPHHIIKQVKETLWKSPGTSPHQTNAEYLPSPRPSSAVNIYNMHLVPTAQIISRSRYSPSPSPIGLLDEGSDADSEDSHFEWSKFRVKSPAKSPHLQRLSPMPAVCECRNREDDWMKDTRVEGCALKVDSQKT